MQKITLTILFLLSLPFFGLSQQKNNTSNTSNSKTNTTQKVDQNNGSNATVLPIPATGYTDPNYEINKAKSEKVQADIDKSKEVAPTPTTKDRIAYLEEKIKYIKASKAPSQDELDKLPYYEAELKELKNK